jgi:hypothetical protein
MSDRNRERNRFDMANLIALVCVICAAVMASEHKDGWGWFLFAAVLIAHW